MNEFYNKYSGYIAFGIFILTIPLSIVANLLTPKLKDWWASRSINSLKVRIEDKKNEIFIIQGLVNNTKGLISFMFLRLSFILFSIIVLIPIFYLLAGNGSNTIIKFTSLIIFATTLAFASSTYESARHIYYFQDWKKSEYLEIKKLQLKLKKKRIRTNNINIPD